jgi:hypothetical protein
MNQGFVLYVVYSFGFLVNRKSRTVKLMRMLPL